MRKPLCLLTILVLAFAAVEVFAQAPGVVYKEVPRTVSGHPFATIQGATFDPHSLANFKAQNHLSYAVNQNIKSAGLKVGNAGFVNGPIDTVPYFQSWFITGSRNSVYPYSMVGHSPKAGGTTTITTQLIPLITVLLTNGSAVAIYDPTISNDPEGDDISLVRQSPIFDATTTYPGPPSETGQFEDGHQRVSFRTSAAANWHTLLTPTSSGITWIQFLESNNGDWAFACCDGHGNNFPVFNINTISNNFEFILSVEIRPTARSRSS